MMHVTSPLNVCWCALKSIRLCLTAAHKMVHSSTFPTILALLLDTWGLLLYVPDNHKQNTPLPSFDLILSLTVSLFISDFSPSIVLACLSESSMAHAISHPIHL